MDYLAYFPIVFFVLFYLFLVFLIYALNKRGFKALLTRFDKTKTVPSQTVYVREFHFGNRMIRNTVRIGEEMDGIVIKIVMISAFKIPYSAFSEIKEERGLIILNFKEALAPLGLRLTSKELEKFPVLNSLKQHGHDEPKLEG